MVSQPHFKDSLALAAVVTDLILPVLGPGLRGHEGAAHFVMSEMEFRVQCRGSWSRAGVEQRGLPPGGGA